jgi:hypothetical protein
MCRMQKFAWFNLAVIGLTVLAIVSLYPLLGFRALGSLGFLGFIGFGPLFFRKLPGQIITDERDQMIHWRAWIFAYALYWVVFVLVAVVVSALVYGEDGAVPVSVVRMSVAGAFMLVYALASIAILVQYSGGAKNAE